MDNDKGIQSILRAGGMNPAAQAATLSYLSSEQSFGLLDKWTEVECADGSKARILKNPEDAFELYAKEWSSKFNVVVDIVQQVKASGTSDVNNKIVKLFDNLGSVEATLREMYKNAYLTFAATPCSEKSQEEKRKMDRIIIAASLSLLSIKSLLESAIGQPGGTTTPGSPDTLQQLKSEILKLVDRITSQLMY